MSFEMHLHHAAQRLAPTRRKDTEVILCIGAVNTGAMILISIERWLALGIYRARRAAILRLIRV